MAAYVVPLDSPKTRTRAWDDFCDDWLPFDRLQRIKTRKASPWDWDPFDWHIHLIASNFESAAAVDSAGTLLGLISISKERYPDFLSVEYIQTTPRNHGSLRTIGGLGQMLLQWAVDRSVAHGFKGGLKLISKPATSGGFYLKLGFAQVGSIQGFKIFAISPQNVANSPAQARLKVRTLP